MDVRVGVGDGLWGKRKSETSRAATIVLYWLLMAATEAPAMAILLCGDFSHKFREVFRDTIHGSSKDYGGCFGL